MVRKINYLLFGILLVALLLNLACSRPGVQDTAEIRMANFLQTKGPATCILYRDNEAVKNFTLHYENVSTYQEIPTGSYLIKVAANDQLLLEKKLGLGRNGKYTLCLTGIPEANQMVNQQSNYDRMYKMVAGTAAVTPNAYLPQLLVLNDFFVPEPGKGKIRFVHVMPGTVPLDVKLFGPEGKSYSFSGLSYPQQSATDPIRAANWELNIHLQSSPGTILQKNFTSKSDLLYTYFIAPDSQSFLNIPKIIGVETER